jgi:hypothetical protein
MTGLNGAVLGMFFRICDYWAYNQEWTVLRVGKPARLNLFEWGIVFRMGWRGCVRGGKDRRPLIGGGFSGRWRGCLTLIGALPLAAWASPVVQNPECFFKKNYFEPEKISISC